jgi:hypothetical protein
MSQQSESPPRFVLALLGGVASALLIVGTIGGLDHALHNHHLIGAWPAACLGGGSWLVGFVWGWKR